MSVSILLACIVPSLAVMAVAAYHGFRTGHAGVLLMLALSLGLLAGPALVAPGDGEEPAVGFRFDVAGAAAKRHAALSRAAAAPPAPHGL